MIELNANVARFHFEAVHLAPETFQVASFTGCEAISQPYRFDLNLVSKDPSVDFAGVINQPATFTMVRSFVPMPDSLAPIPIEVPVHGIVAHFKQAGRTADHVAYQATLVPRLWWLSLNYRSRVFQQMTVVEIVEHMLDTDGPRPILYRFDLLADYPSREYCVQYHETDLDFINRLLEFEGISYFFESFGEHERIVFTDQQNMFAPITPDSTIRYHQGAGMVGKKIEKVHDLVCREQVVPGRVLLKDYNEEIPDVDLRAESQLNDDMPGTQYEYGLHFEDIDQGKRLARVRNQEIEARRRVLDGTSNCMGFRSGHRFTLANHYRPDLNEDYLLTQIEHRGGQKEAMGLLDEVGGDGQENNLLYRNTFTCIPASVPYRPPRRTPIPQVPGVMTARMEARDPEDKYAYLDEEGRYRARMHFDLRDTEEAPPANASKPIRMNQPYSGRRYGLHLPNHAGAEMVWSCINGNPDRPMALGTVPNANTLSPVTSANRQQSVLRTEGGNELTFDDTKGAENIYLHATSNHHRDVTNNETITIGGKQSITVGKGRESDIQEGGDFVYVRKGDHGSWVYDGDYHLYVHEGMRNVEIKKDDTLVVEGSQSITVGEGRESDIQEGGDFVYVRKGDHGSWVYDGDYHLYVHEGARNVEIKKDDALGVLEGNRIVNIASGDEIKTLGGGHRTVTLMAGDDTLNALHGHIVRTAVGGIKLVCGASTIELTPEKIIIDSPRVEINC